jgi:hypothetical protein
MKLPLFVYLKFFFISAVEIANGMQSNAYKDLSLVGGSGSIRMTIKPLDAKIPSKTKYSPDLDSFKSKRLDSAPGA